MDSETLKEMQKVFFYIFPYSFSLILPFLLLRFETDVLRKYQSNETCIRECEKETVNDSE